MLNENFKFIIDIQKELTLLSNTISLLIWDMETYMPEKGIKARGEQLAYLEKMYHDKITSNALFEKINNIDKSNLNEDDEIIVERFLKDIEKSRKIPSEIIEELAKITTNAFSSWKEAKEKKDFTIFQPYLEKIVELKKKEAKYVGIKGHIYNSLLDSFEEGMTVEKLEISFEKLKQGLIRLLEKVKSSDNYSNQKILYKNKKFSEENQIELSKDVSRRIGLDNKSSRIDFAEHPFTIKVGEDDVRITTNINKPFFSSFESTIHESGHGLYELNLPKKYSFTILSNAPSFGLHESQSRFWENMVGKSKPFLEYYFEEFKKRYGFDDFEELYNQINLIFPNKIRTESDEIHYCLHVILRFEIEKDLIEGKIEVKNLPKVWAEKMKELIGVVPEDDGEGVLQDVHWSQGFFGYFPTYALGTIYATQIYGALKKRFPNIEEDIGKGDYLRIREWLNNSIHKHGRKFLAEDIIKSVCGEGLNPDYFLDYLTKKYSEIYGFD